MGAEVPSDHWPLHARQWNLVGSPLRPGPEDVAIVEAEVRACERPRVVLLGVTPELATLRWPAGTSLLAIDRSRAMIDTVFPAGAGHAVAGEWTALPCATGSVDVVAGDGALSNLAFPLGYRAFAGEQHRVLAAGGRLILRLFAAPDPGEQLADVGRALAAGRIGSFHALKWRVAMAIQPADRNVAVVEILHALDRVAPDRAALAALTGWPAAVIATIEAYRDSALRYSFPTLAEVREVLAGHFTEVACRTPAYELGERCPTLVLQPR
jgi:SAM-dependent methyltransferase